MEGGVDMDRTSKSVRTYEDRLRELREALIKHADEQDRIDAEKQSQPQSRPLPKSA
jgi:hypothetical protein